MASTMVQAVFGFGFWILCARLFSAEQVGLASALISAATFIAYVSLFGFNSAFVRFLPTSKRRNEQINTGLIIVLVVATLISIAYIATIQLTAPSLTFVQDNHAYAIGFIVLSALGAANLLTDSVFVAYRASAFNLWVYSAQSVIKLALPLVFVSLGAYGVFVASGLSAAIALVLSLAAMSIWHNYRPMIRVSMSATRRMWQFTSVSYVANLLNIIPILVLPIIILDRLGAASAGYFYLALMLVNLIYAIGYSVCQSLFAEGSYGDTKLGDLVKRATKFLMAIMIPASILLAIIGPYVLQIFGKSYGDGSTPTLIILALAAPAVAMYVMTSVLLRLRQEHIWLIITNAFYVVSICGLSWLWVDRGLEWVAWSWLVGNVLTAALSLGVLWLGRAKPTREIDDGLSALI